MNNRSRDLNTLLLSAGELSAPRVQYGVHAHGHRLDLLCETGHGGGLPRLIDAEVSSAHDVLEYIAADDLSVLKYDPKLPSNRFDVEEVQIVTV
ncbi:MAG: hypothetical protein VX374_07670, partial [Pseudomonadota bacterium]|nr:hypothetical protein [Pseudomonadota bacterium]